MSARHETIYQGKIIDLHVEQARLPNGRDCELEIVDHPGGVAILALDQDERICLLRQYRHVAQGWLWEFPAGKKEPGEQAQKTAARELLEEAGVRAGNMTYMGSAYASPGVFTEVIDLFLATDLQPAEHMHEPEEIIEVHWLDIVEVKEMVITDRINDAKTLAALCHFFLKIDNDSTSR